MHGQFVWYDLMTSDAAAARKYYPSLLGWGTQKFEQSAPDQPYTMWTVDGTPLGGVVQLKPEERAQGIRPHWLPSVEVNNVDETARKASSLGGKVVFGPSDIPDTGRYAVILDPQGAHFAIFTPSGGPMWSFDGTPALGRFSWHELITTDYNKALDFYRQLFGWEKTDAMDMGGGAMYQMYGMKGKHFGGMFNRRPDMGNMPPSWVCYVNVEDARKTAAEVVRSGGKIAQGPMQPPGGDWVATVIDPQGAMFAVHSVTTKTAAPAKTKPATPSKSKAKVLSKARPKARTKAAAKAKSRVKAKAKTKTRSRPKPKARKKARRR